MKNHKIQRIIELCDKAITEKNFDTLMEFYAEDASLVVKPGMVVQGKESIRKAFIAISEYFQRGLVVEQGEMQVIEGAGNALVIMETRLKYPGEDGRITETVRRATYVFTRHHEGSWLCSIDNSYGTDLLDFQSSPLS